MESSSEKSIVESSISFDSLMAAYKPWFDEARVAPKDREHLIRSLLSLVSAQDPVPSFNLYGKTDITVARQFLDSVKWDSELVPPGWKEYEYDRLSKYGGQGGHPSWSDMQELMDMYHNRLSSVRHVDEDVIARLSAALRHVVTSELGHLISKSTPDVSLAKLIAADKVFPTAGGCRRFSLKKTDLVCQISAVQDLKSGLYKKFFMYVFEKFQKLKPRIFMPGPFSNMIDQATWLVPLRQAVHDSIRNLGADSPVNCFAAEVGFDTLFYGIKQTKINRAVSRLATAIPNFDRKKVHIMYCQGDFEKMDTTTGPSQYREIFFPITESCIDAQYIDDYRTSMLATVTMPIATPYGMFEGDHGTGSGMESTHDGEDYCNWYFGTKTLDTFYAQLTPFSNDIYSFKLDDKSALVTLVDDQYNGDDSSFDFIVYTDTPDICGDIGDIFFMSAKATAADCGFRIKEGDKWRIETDTFGLYNQHGYWYEYDQISGKYVVRYMYPSALIINSIVNPWKQYKAADWHKEYRDNDIIEKLDNGKGLPYHHQLIDYVDNGMKYRLLGRSENETRRILKMYLRYRALQGQDDMWNRRDYDITKSATLHYVLPKRYKSIKSSDVEHYIRSAMVQS